MRLPQNVLPTLRQTKKPQQKFVAHLLGLLLMLPGHATFRNLSRYSAYHERTFARWYARDFDFVSLNKAAIIQVIPPAHEQALVLDASFVPKSGKKTYGLDRFWNGSHSRTEKGLEISALAWLDITDNCAYGLSVEQTPPADKTTGAEATRIDVYLDQLARVVSAHHLSHLRYVITDGYYSKQKFLGGVRALGLEQIGKLRLDANLRYLYQGPQRPGPGRPKTYDGKVNWDNLSRFEKVETEDDEIVLYHQVLNHVQFQCNLRVVLVVDTKHHRRAVLFSTDVRLGRFDHLPLLQSALPNRVSVQRRQTVYRFDRLSSALTSQAQLSLQCQSERGHARQTRSPSAQRGCRVSVFHGEPQAACLQSTSDRANFSAFSPGAQLGKIQPRLRRAL